MTGSAPLIEVIKNRLYWCSASPADVPRTETNIFVFSIDDELVYFPFFQDFGPLNMGLTYRFCRRLDRLLKDPQHADKKIIHLCSVDYAKRANAACLLACFMMLVHGKSANEAWLPFTKASPFVPYRDATTAQCSYPNTILDCLRGLEKAIKLGWFDFRTFDIRDYEHCEKVENGDMSWIVPHKFFAFSGPTTHGIVFDGNLRTYTPQDYVPVFHRKNIKHVVRLNNIQYDRQIFTQNGINHTDLYFTDGSCPPQNIIDRFLQITEAESGAFAVHCKAGLGRTGTLIGIYAMKHYQFPAAAFIGWSRLMRPGCVLGPQQQFLNGVEHVYFGMGSIITGLAPLYLTNGNNTNNHRNANSSSRPASNNDKYGHSMMSGGMTPSTSCDTPALIAFNGNNSSNNNMGKLSNMMNTAAIQQQSQSQLKDDEISHNTIGVSQSNKVSPLYGSMNDVARYGDAGQGERLVEARQAAMTGKRYY